LKINNVTNRKRRLKKGIESIEKEIKKQNAIAEKRLELVDYYTSEIEALKEQKKEKEEKLKK